MTGWKKWIHSFLHFDLGNEAVAATEKLMQGVRRLGIQTTGAIEYMLHPDRGIAWGGPFNGQRSRQELFQRAGLGNLNGAISGVSA